MNRIKATFLHSASSTASIGTGTNLATKILCPSILLTPGDLFFSDSESTRNVKIVSHKLASPRKRKTKSDSIYTSSF